MTFLYAAQAASALATLKRKGAAVTFIDADVGTYNPTAGTFSGATTTTVAGYAVAIDDDFGFYRELELVAGKSKTLLFGSTTAGSLPGNGLTVSWDGVAYTVKGAKALGPDGTAIVGTVVVSR